MVTTPRSISRVFMISLATGMMLVAAMPASAQDLDTQHQPLIQDWTTHHVVFSSPGSADDAIRAGRYEQWLKIVNDPRYIMQQRLRAAHVGDPAAIAATATNAALQAQAETESNAGLTAATDAIEMTLEQRDLARGGNHDVPSGLVRALIPPSQPSMTLSSSRGDPLPPLRNGMKNDWSENMGSNATVGLGNYPATYSTGSTSCTDFAIYNTGLPGSSGQASIVAYKNLYTAACGNPAVYWAYNTSGTIFNSVILSFDGTQVGFIQSVSGVATLVLVKWTASGGSVTSPTTPTSVGNSSYRACSAPCMTSITLHGSPNDTYSYPYYDSSSDTIYVGDDGGALHKFTNIFLSGTPTEATSPWPVTVFPGTSGLSALGAPIYDSNSNKVFVGDYLLNAFSNCAPSANTVNGSCGYLYSVNAATGAVTKSALLDFNFGIVDAPLLDGTVGEVYAFIGDDGSTNCGTKTPCSAVAQFLVTFGGGATGTRAVVGPGYEFMMSGNFDNTYFNSGTGKLYVIGNTGPANNTLYQIPITSGVMGTSAVTGPALATNYTNSYYAAGLQITEFFNSPHDYIFLSVLAFGVDTANIPCPGQSLLIGCLMGFDVTSGTISSSTPATGVLQEAGGTSGIVVDNTASAILGGSNIYFSTLLNQTCATSGGTGGCAVQTSQAIP